jgi:hypothetical protein
MSEVADPDYAVLQQWIIQSPWFQARWGEKFRITADQNTKSAVQQRQVAMPPGDVGRGSRSARTAISLR